MTKPSRSASKGRRTATGTIARPNTGTAPARPARRTARGTPPAHHTAKGLINLLRHDIVAAEELTPFSSALFARMKLVERRMRSSAPQPPAEATNGERTLAAFRHALAVYREAIRELKAERCAKE